MKAVNFKTLSVVVWTLLLVGLVHCQFVFPGNLGSGGAFNNSLPGFGNPSSVVLNPGNGQNDLVLLLSFSLDEAFANNVRSLAQTISQRIRDQDQFFLNIGVDRRREGASTTGQHRNAIATTAEAQERGTTKRVQNAVLQEITNTLLPSVGADSVRSQVQNFVSDLVVQSLTTKDDNCLQFNNIVCNATHPYRMPDGSCNNLRRPLWGRALIPLRRFLPPVYEDGNSKPRNKSVTGSPLPSARLVSRVVHESDSVVPEDSSVSHMTMQFGQFVDHDITSTPVQTGTNGASPTCCEDDVPLEVREQFRLDLPSRDICMPIFIPEGDSRFSNRKCLSFARSIQIANAECKSQPVEQMNQITAFIDGSQIYGSSLDEQRGLRLMRQGLMNVSRDDLLPEDQSPVCTKSSKQNFCFLAGDGRVNEQMSLATVQTLFLRYHNLLAARLAAMNTRWEDEKVYQETRKIVGATLQNIIYNGFLPVVMSSTWAQSFRLPSQGDSFEETYNENTDPSIRNVFASAAYRFGHSLVRTWVSRYDQNNRPVASVPETAMFFNVSMLQDSSAGINNPINAHTRGLLQDGAARCDRFMSTELTENLFRDSRGNSLDLASLNIQRGRDHALQPYNAWRSWCGLAPATNFGTGQGGLVDMQPDAAQRLSSVYRHPDDIDVFTGGLSERSVAGGMVGPLLACLLGHQFKALKEGDRFWYERPDPVTGFTLSQLRAIKRTSLSSILCQTAGMDSVQIDSFRRPGASNPTRTCNDIAVLDLTPWSTQPQEARTQAPPAIGWSNWGSWQLPCRGSQQFRERTCDPQAGPFGSCIGPNFESRSCPPSVCIPGEGRAIQPMFEQLCATWS